MIAYTSPYIPAEFIAAHGLQPFRMRPSQASRPHQGQCPFASAFVAELQAGRFRAAIFATTCDQMRRAPQCLSRTDLPIFLMNVPATWQSPAAAQMYQGELRRLGQFLLTVGGNPCQATRLAELMLQYAAARKRLAAASPNLSARQYQQALTDLHQCPPASLAAWSPSANESRFCFGWHGGRCLPPCSDQPPPSKDLPNNEKSAAGIPLAIVGGPLTPAGLDLLDIIEQSAGRVVLDATETGLRGLPADPDLRQLAADPLTELAAMYFGHLPDAFRRPNTRLYDWLSREIALRQPRGMIVIHPLWCDLWHAEAPRLRDATGLPTLHLTDAGTASARESLATRIQSFLEMLR